jgi:hydroxypyruvate isomerase
MDRDPGVSRRTLLTTAGAGAAVAAAVGRLAAEPAPPEAAPIKGNIGHSACWWCYNGKKVPLEELAVKGKAAGLRSIELIGENEFAVVKKHGLTCAITWGAGPLPDCLAKKANHDRCEAELRKNIAFAADAGIPSVICFSGNREPGLTDEEGLDNCAEGVKRVLSLAEEKKVTICIELLNSKINHPNYMCDRTDWGVRLIKKVGSERFKLLYDIYHMQIMEGDVIATIRANKDYIAHYHTGGVPGRNEIDETQELYYPAVVKAILETGYTGFLGQEFVPKRDPLTSLAQAIRICDV